MTLWSHLDITQRISQVLSRNGNAISLCWRRYFAILCSVTTWNLYKHNATKKKTRNFWAVANIQSLAVDILLIKLYVRTLKVPVCVGAFPFAEVLDSTCLGSGFF